MTSPDAHSGRSGLIRSLYELTKPGIAAYVVLLTAACAYVAGRGQAEWLLLVHLSVGVAVATAGSLALNQYIEREVDSRMRRTRTRPLPEKRITPRTALVFSLLMFGGGCLYLGVTVGWLPAALTLASGLAYDFVYTPMKSRSYLATLAGAIPGAVPALIGWSATAGDLSQGAWVLFGIAYLWQMPHVLGLVWVLKADYKEAGFRLSPPSDPDGRVIGLHMILYSATLVPVSILPTVIGLTGGVYFIGALALGLWLVWLCVLAWRSMTKASARRVFLASLAYQPALLALLLFDTVKG
jgi:protoheme IX farnesyltransferase